MKLKFFYLLILFNITFLYSQNNVHVYSIEDKLDEYASIKPSINNTIKIDITGLPLNDFITTLAHEHQLNISIDSELNYPVVNNFYDVTVKDAFLFLCSKYDLDVVLMKNILIFKKKEKKIEKIIKQKKNIDVSYKTENDFLSFKLENDTLNNVIKEIVDKSGKNIILSPSTKNVLVSSYILNRPLEQALSMLAKSNDLYFEKNDEGYFYFDTYNDNSKEDNNIKYTNKNRNNKSTLDNFELKLLSDNKINIKTNNTEIYDIIYEVGNKLNVNYFFYNKPENEKITLNNSDISFDDLLEHLFKGRKYNFKKINDIYIIGEQTTEGIRATELVQFENRSIENILTVLPKIFTEKIEIKEIMELNSLVISGYKSHIEELKFYLKQLDKVVPLVQIDVMIVQYNKSHDVQTGLKAGLDKLNRTTTSGVLFPNTEMNLNNTSVNDLISAFNGLGIVKIGKVTDAFYMNLKLLENNSIIKIESTPKIATLSGHEANLAIGETSYYYEQNNRILNNNIGNGGDILQSGVWKSTDANLSVKIKPIVSADENVTLNINVEKSSFLGRAGENAPPGKATQKFDSLIRIKNNEMVLLGGLDELKKENSGTGTPLLSRIPIIKWFFSSKIKSKSDSKLHIFIKPTIIY